MIFDPNLLLTAEELTTPRSPTELAHWVEHKCRLFVSYNEAKNWVLLHEGLYKKFYEEVYPLSLFATHVYDGRSDIQCAPNLDNRDFDAIIIDYSKSPPSELKVEITSTFSPEEYLRMKYFVQHGEVNIFGKLSASGTKKRGHKIHVEKEAIKHSDLLERTFSLIRSRVERKCVRPNEPQKYGRGHILIVAFDDWEWFGSKQDVVALENFVKENILRLPLNFALLYVLGLSGRLLLHFKLATT
jgi:hypothetical protein